MCFLRILKFNITHFHFDNEHKVYNGVSVPGPCSLRYVSTHMFQPLTGPFVCSILHPVDRFGSGQMTHRPGSGTNKRHTSEPKIINQRSLSAVFVRITDGSRSLRQPATGVRVPASCYIRKHPQMWLWLTKDLPPWRSRNTYPQESDITRQMRRHILRFRWLKAAAECMIGMRCAVVETEDMPR